MLMIRLSI